MRGALAGLLHVRDGDVQVPPQTIMEIADGYGWSAADARGAVEINGVAFGKQFTQRLDAAVELGAQIDLFLDDGSAAKRDGTTLVVGFEGRPIQIDRAHVVVGVDVEHGRDARFTAKTFDIFDGTGMGSDKEAREDLRVSEFFAGESFHFA